jgi:hypothetical protein
MRGHLATRPVGPTRRDRLGDPSVLLAKRGPNHKLSVKQKDTVCPDEKGRPLALDRHDYVGVLGRLRNHEVKARVERMPHGEGCRRLLYERK